MTRLDFGILLKRTVTFLVAALLITTTVDAKPVKTYKKVEAKQKKKTIKKKKTTRKKKTKSVSREGAVNRDIAAYAKRFIGTPYVYGGSSPSTGFDCSGFTSYIMRQYGVSLYRSARDQARNGVAVSRSELRAGDLILFHTTRPGISHVGMYIGNGQFIHASSGKVKAVTISNLNSGYYNTRVVTCRRVLR